MFRTFLGQVHGSVQALYFMMFVAHRTDELARKTNRIKMAVSERVAWFAEESRIHSR